MLPGEEGACHCRANEDGRLVAKNGGWLRALSLEPVERIGLSHFYPGKNALRVGSYGCPLKCSYCTTPSLHTIRGSGRFTTPWEICQLAEALLDRNNCGVAYSYSEPLMWYEFLLRTATQIQKIGMANIVSTSAYINIQPLSGLLQVIDAWLIDIGFAGEYGLEWYCRKAAINKIFASGRHLELKVWLNPQDPFAVDNIASFASYVSEAWTPTIPLHIAFPHHLTAETTDYRHILTQAKEKSAEFLQSVEIEGGQTAKKRYKAGLVKETIIE